ncbi:replication factor C subunit 4-like [Oppia nitens]|uniref:replication factor C subunit 4-like n=1 Tax=Oppia nitens TaxID=1686743 RepID=UPI0023DAC58D|nr:replication factor C subunit 4-like [Oppia nitens]
MNTFFKNFKQSSTTQPTEEPMDEEDVVKVNIKLSLKPWVEKYRPNTIDEVVYQTHIVSMLSKYLTTDCFNELPNLLLYGPPGTGKTSTIIALAKQLFQNQYKNRVLELNASDERGIGVIREKVKSFAQQSVSTTTKSIPALKLIILDECDSMTRDAQSALRRTMEREAKTTRFCLICNYVSRIIEPLVSRCSAFRFKLLDSQLSVDKLRQIADLESVRISDELINQLVTLSEGDLRRAITLLQSVSQIKESDEEVDINDIHEVAGYIPNRFIDQFIQICRSKSYENLTDFVTELIAEGYSGAQFLLQIHDWLIDCDQLLLSDKQKSIISERIAFNDKRLLDGADEFLQILDIGAIVLKTIDRQ